MATKKQSAGELSTQKRNSLAEETFAFPNERKMPLSNASHVRNAIARFNQVKGVSSAEKKAAFTRVKAAAKKFGVDMTPATAAGLATKGPAKKTTPKKTPAKKSSAKKTPAKKSSAKKTPTKKSSAKKTPARKSSQSSK